MATWLEFRRVLFRSVLTGSGTDALQRAIVCACQRIGRGAVAAIPAYGCYDIATAAIGAEVRFFLYDIDPVTLGPDLDSLGSAIAAGASVIVVAPLYGVPVEWGEIVALVSRVGGVIVEDAAQAHGASWQGFPLGSLGDYSVLSFGRGKGWSGGGRGGTLLSRGPAADAIDSEGYDDIVGPGWTTIVLAFVQWLLGRPPWYGIPASIPYLGLGETQYRDPTPSCGMQTASAVLLRMTASPADRYARGRRDRANELLQRLPLVSYLSSIATEMDKSGALIMARERKSVVPALR